jgi:hypothetical protein
MHEVVQKLVSTHLFCFQDLKLSTRDIIVVLKDTLNTTLGPLPILNPHDVGDFVYLQRQPNDTLNTSSNHTILRIKAIKASGVLELQGADGRTI